MQRWVFPAGGTGVDDLELREAPVPTPGPGEVRLRVGAVSLNFRDQLLLMGQYGGTPTADVTPVSDAAGTVDAVGAGVEDLRVGDRVTSLYYPAWADGPLPGGLGIGPGTPGDPGYLAEHVVVAAGAVTRTPPGLSDAEAAALSCAGLTAWTALYGDRPYTRTIGPGDRVLVLGSGGVSLIAAQLAVAAGAEVTATSSSDEKLARTRQLGATHTVNYRTTPRWGERVFALTGGVHRVVNAVGSSALDQAIHALANGGEIALMGFMDQAELAPDFIALMTKAATIRGTRVGSAAAHADLAQTVERRGIKLPIHRRFPMAEAREAYRAQLAPDVFGKVVIEVGA
jgi:NADPH:quinone reductase-like Zn-dependent oxidoreductase